MSDINQFCSDEYLDPYFDPYCSFDIPDLSIDPYLPDYNVSPSYISQSRVGTPWVSGASNQIGYTVDFTIKINDVEANSSAYHDIDNGSGILINDGHYKEVVFFYQQSIYCKYAQVEFVADNTTESSYRITVKDSDMDIYVKNTTIDQSFRHLGRVKLVAKSHAGLIPSSASIFFNGQNGYAAWMELPIDGTVIGGNNGDILYSSFQDGSWSAPVVVASGSSPVILDGNIWYLDNRAVSVVRNIDNNWTKERHVSTSVGYDGEFRILSIQNEKNIILWTNSDTGINNLYFAEYDRSTSELRKHTVLENIYSIHEFNAQYYMGYLYLSCLTHDEYDDSVIYIYKIDVSSGRPITNKNYIIKKIEGLSLRDHSLYVSTGGYIGLSYIAYGENFESSVFTSVYNSDMAIIHDDVLVTSSSSMLSNTQISEYSGSIVVFWLLDSMGSLYDSNKNQLFMASILLDSGNIGFSTGITPDSCFGIIDYSVSKKSMQFIDVISTYYSYVEEDEYGSSYNTAYSPTLSNWSLYDNSLYAISDIAQYLDKKEIRIGNFSNNIRLKVDIRDILMYFNGAIVPYEIYSVSNQSYGLSFENHNSSGESENTCSSKYEMFATESLVSDSGNSIFINNLSRLWMFDSSHQTLYTNIFDNADSLPRASSIAADLYNNIYIVAESELWYVTKDAQWNKVVVSGEDPGPIRHVDIYGDNIVLSSTDGKVSTGSIVLNSDLTISVLISFSSVVKKGSSSALIYKSVIDKYGTVWVCSNAGLGRIDNNGLVMYNKSNGLIDSVVNDIAIVSDFVRYIATSNGLVRMEGGSFATVYDDNIYSNNIKSICFEEPNILWFSSSSSLNQAIIRDNDLVISRLNIDGYTNKSISHDNFRYFESVSSPDETLLLMGESNRQSESGVVSKTRIDVFINGNYIGDRFYNYSISNKTIYLEFVSPLLPSDVVSLVVYGGSYNIVGTNGTVGYLTVDHISNSVVVGYEGESYTNTFLLGENNDGISLAIDRSPPDIENWNIDTSSNATSDMVRVILDNVTDDLSGVDKMVVSTYDNFTSDGATPLVPVDFQSEFYYQVSIGQSLPKVEYSFENTNGARLFSPDGSQIFAITSSPCRIYKMSESSWQLVSDLGDLSLGVMEYTNRLILGLNSNESPESYLYVMSPSLLSVDSVVNTGPGRLSCSINIGKKIYIGQSSSIGSRILEYTGGASVTELISGLDTNLTGMSRSMDPSFIYVSSGDNGLLYKVSLGDTISSSIVHKSSSKEITDVQIVEDILYIGTDDADILKTDNAMFAFNKIFTSSPDRVRFKIIDNQIYAIVGKTIYTYNNSVWKYEAAHYENINDLFMYSNSESYGYYIISNNSISRVSVSLGNRNIFLKLIDRAGNETSVFNDDMTYNSKFYRALTSDDIASSINNMYSQNRIIEVDPNTNQIDYTLYGENTFYSGERIEKEIGIYYSYVFNGTNDLLKWNKMSWSSIETDGTSVQMYIRTSDSKNDIYKQGWIGPFDKSHATGVDLSIYSGQYFQFKAELISTTKDVTAQLFHVFVESLSVSSSHLFTTNFALPENVTRGILTSQKIVPVSADIVFGINTSNSVNWSDYQEIDENRMFVVDNPGKNLRIGVKFLSPNTNVVSESEIVDLSPYGDPVFTNTVDYKFTSSVPDGLYHIWVEMYKDFNDEYSIIYNDSSISNPDSFIINGEGPSDIGFEVNFGTNNRLIYYLPGNAPIECGEYYGVKVYIGDGISEYILSDDHYFVSTCSPTDINNLSFSYTSDAPNNSYFNFRARFYSDIARTDLVYTSFSGNMVDNWHVNNTPFSFIGHEMDNGEVCNVDLYIQNDSIVPNTIYFVSIDTIYDGSFINISNNHTFGIFDNSDDVYCGEYSNVPVLKNFAITFELENYGQVTINNL